MKRLEDFFFHSTKLYIYIVTFQLISRSHLLDNYKFKTEFKFKVRFFPQLNSISYESPRHYINDKGRKSHSISFSLFFFSMRSHAMARAP